MDTQQYRRVLKDGDKAIFDKDYKGIKWVEKELKRVEKITNQEEQNKEAEKVWWICDRVYNSFSKVPNGVDPNEPYGFNRFKKLYERLKYLKNKTSQGQNNSNSKKCSNCQGKIISAWGVNQDYCSIKCCLQVGVSSLLTGINNNLNSLTSNLKPYAEKFKSGLQEASNDMDVFYSSPEKLQRIVENGSKLESYLPLKLQMVWKIAKYCLEQKIKQLSSQQHSDNNIQNESNQSEYISCQQCFKEIKAGEDYWHHKTKNDGYKFCSTNCYDECYGEYCDKCVKKFLILIPDGGSSYCSTCYEEVKQGEKKSEEQSTRYCKYCSTKLVKENNLKYSLGICDKNDCFLKLDKELYPEKYNDNNNMNSNNSMPIQKKKRQQYNYAPKSPP